MKRKALSFLFALILILTLPLAAVASTGSEARNSVVVVSTCLEMNLGTKGFGHGTGFFVNDQYLVNLPAADARNDFNFVGWKSTFLKPMTNSFRSQLGFTS